MHYYSTPYTKTSDKNTNYTKPTQINTPWGLAEYWLFGDRLLFGDHDRFVKTFNVSYKFVNTGYST